MAEYCTKSIKSNENPGWFQNGLCKLKMTSISYEMRDKVARICREYLHGAWKCVNPDNIQIKHISGGLSNWLYDVSLPPSCRVGTEPREVLLRIYGQIHGDRALEDVITESVIFTLLSERNLGPKLYGVFPGGRIEEYIAAEPLKTIDLSNPRLSQVIAQKLAQIHNLNIPINKEPVWMWDTINRWLKNSLLTLKDRDSILVPQQSIAERLAKFDLSAEVDWLRKFITRMNYPVVFSHNDLQEGNILLKQKINKSDSDLILIDFEYCSYNYRGFDFANHFLEWVYDYSLKTPPYYTAKQEAYPKQQQQLLFINEYLQHKKQLEKQEMGCELNEMESNDEALAILNEVKVFSLASHLFWGLWSIVNAKLSQIPFGYWEYAETRLDNYFALKRELSPVLGVKRKFTNDNV